MNEKRVTIFKNGINTRGLVFRVPSTLNELIRETSVTFNAEIKKIFIEDGSEVKDISFIRAFDKLYVSDGEAFILPPRFNKDPDDWITLNVGGKYFTTSRSTLTRKEPKSMLARMFCEENSDLLVPSSVDRNGAFLIDRSPKYFEPILNFLRCGQLVYDKHINPVGILEEAKYFGIESIISTLEQNINQHKTSRDNLPLTRRDVINALITTSYTAELRFQGVNLSGADLSKLDLRFINFKYANLQECNLKGSNLSWCCLERADLKNAVLDNAQLLVAMELFMVTMELFTNKLSIQM